MDSLVKIDHPDRYGIDENTLNILKEIQPFIHSKIETVLDQFYHDIDQIPEAAKLLADPEIRERARAGQKYHLLNEVYAGHYDQDYYDRVKQLGLFHWERGIDLGEYTSAYHRVLGYFTHLIIEEFNDKPSYMLHVIMAVQRVTFMDMELTTKAYESCHQAYQHKLIHTDPLTGIGNRRSMMTDLEEGIEAYEHGAEPLSLALMDLDRFKGINDHFGHVIGDKILKKFSNDLHKNLRQTDTIFRFGGDEFAVVMHNTHSSHAVKILERARKSISTDCLSCNLGKVHINFSAGVAEYKLTYNTVESFIEKADLALYLAKKQGRGQIKEFADPHDKPIIRSSKRG